MGGGGGTIMAGDVTISFPPIPAPSNSPITVNTPPSAYPQVVTSPKK